jgi:dihydrofolate reductase
MPRKIIGAAFVSLDGVMQAPGGPTEDPTGGFAYGGWLFGLDDDEIGEKIGEVFGRPFELLLGRRTYDIFAAYWPYIPDSNPIAESFNRIPKHVLTHSDAPLDWAGSRRLASVDDIAALKAEIGPDLIIQGSSTLYPQLLRHGLIDQLHLMVAPILLGAGKKLFGDGTPPVNLRPIAQKISRKGTLIASYEPAGEPPVGSFEGPPPSERELARREKIEQGVW